MPGRLCDQSAQPIEHFLIVAHPSLFFGLSEASREKRLSKIPHAKIRSNQ